MKRSDKIIITCAVTGSVHTPTMSDVLPITPEEIASHSIEAASAGAAVLHLHARDPADGRPTPDPDVFARFLTPIKESCDAVINITTGGSTRMTLEERMAAPKRFSPELCSLNLGSMNFVMAAGADRFTQWKYDWERPYLVGSLDTIYSNTFTQIERLLREVGMEHGTRFECECYDVGHLYTLAYFAEKRLIEPPFFIQCVFGVLGGIGADPENLQHMVRIADKLFGDDYRLSVLAAGRHQMNFVTHAALLGGNVRVGLEDSLHCGRGRMASSNADQVAKVRRILEELSLQIATPSEAREMLKLKGAGSVNF